ncbi:universal stress protein [Cellulomonas chengniuliangii]|uniref:Universal stress protein n=1 Tax=Cellulomonas chengniuliangii TaxID=2968084 RepID=A0ABY5L2A4_9CELL|nr:universal stress protein [Cellulomonas chengniuliangii]MCC2308104.1 universal stress protein [Cellulomonas chengniuliangii]MCC2318325.1 universal stress protein [Cellulomonas chengniuliangii]UUI76499.1 universal stress protein [Cellulomonas chengniuliangii]
MFAEGPIVVALDGTPHSASTLQFGVEEALRAGAPLVLARAPHEPHRSIAWAYACVPGAMGGYVPKDDTTAFLERTRAEVSLLHPGLRVSARVLRGPLLASLCVLSHDARMLVVGARGVLGRPGPGANSAFLARSGHCPVAVVPAMGVTAPSAWTPVVVGVDGSPASVAAARTAAASALRRGVPLLLAHARASAPGPRPRRGSAPRLGDPADPCHDGARSVAALIGAEHPALEVRLTLMDDDPARSLVELGRDAALVVVGSRGLGPVRGQMMGAVSRAVIRSAPCPVLVLRESMDPLRHVGGAADGPP